MRKSLLLQKEAGPDTTDISQQQCDWSLTNWDPFKVTVPKQEGEDKNRQIRVSS